MRPWMDDRLKQTVFIRLTLKLLKTFKTDGALPRREDQPMKRNESGPPVWRYVLLRTRMHECGLRISDLARATGVSSAHINDILAARSYPKIDLCYDILKRLDVPPAELPYYFPPGGITLERQTPRAAETFPRKMVFRMNGEISLTVEDEDE